MELTERNMLRIFQPFSVLQVAPRAWQSSPGAPFLLLPASLPAPSPANVIRIFTAIAIKISIAIVKRISTACPGECWHYLPHLSLLLLNTSVISSKPVSLRSSLFLCFSQSVGPHIFLIILVSAFTSLGGHWPCLTSV